MACDLRAGGLVELRSRDLWIMPPSAYHDFQDENPSELGYCMRDVRGVALPVIENCTATPQAACQSEKVKDMGGGGEIMDESKEKKELRTAAIQHPNRKSMKWRGWGATEGGDEEERWGGALCLPESWNRDGKGGTRGKAKAEDEEREEEVKDRPLVLIAGRQAG